MNHAERVIIDTPDVIVSAGAGGGLLSNFEQLVRGVWKPETNELLKMS